MIALSEHLRNHGYDPTIEKHTRIPGIWDKLRTMYNLDIIDKQENAFDNEDSDDSFLEFKLPEEEYEEAMFMKGKLSPSEASSSPSRMERSPSLPPVARKRKRGDTLTRNRASTVEDTDEPRTSRTSSPAATGKATRKGRGANRSMGRVKAESSERAASKDTTMDEETEEGGEEDEEEDDEDRESSPNPKPTSKSTPKAKSGTPSKAQGAAPRKSKRKR